MRQAARRCAAPARWPHRRRCLMLALLLAAGVVLWSSVPAAAAGSEAAEQAPNGSSWQDYHQRARSSAQSVLASPEFARMTDESESLPRLLARQVQRFFQAIPHLPLWLRWLLLIWCSLTVLAILAHLVYTLMQTVRGADQAASAAAPAATVELTGDELPSFTANYERALALLGAGQYRQAARLLYLAALLLLDERSLLAYRPCKTNGQYLRELASPAYAGKLQGMTQRFEIGEYGSAEPDQQLCQDLHLNLEALRHEPAPTQE